MRFPKSHLLPAVLLCCSLTAAPANQALASHDYQAGVPAPGVASGDDYYEIVDLDARFCFGLDSGARNGQMFADVFLPDGVLVDSEGHQVRGAAELAKFAVASSAPDSTRRHFTVNMRVQKATGGMRQWTYLLVTGPSGGKEGVIEGGQYWDDLVRTPRGWRIKQRTFLAAGVERPEASVIFTLSVPVGNETSPVVEHKQTDSGLSALDRAQILQLYAHYPFAFDKALDGGQLFANLFAPDGTMQLPDGTIVTGRNQLAEYVWSRGLTDIKTYITNVMLNVTPTGVEARSYVMTANIPQIPAPASISPEGVFIDQIVKTAEGWRFQRKTLVPFRSGLANLETATSNQITRMAKKTAKAESPFTADDYAAIQQLYSRYAHGFDSKVEDGAVYLSVFTKTGRFTDQYNKIVDGLAGIDKTYAHSQTGRPNPISVGHSTWNLMADPAPWGAIGRSYTGGGRVNVNVPVLVPGLLGEYLDMIVRTPDGWRFERRIFRQDFQRPVGQVGGGRGGAPTQPARPSPSTN
jgi:hypothetical protein